MSWIQKLHETYENCRPMIGVITNEKQVPLLPICHTTQKAQIEITIDGDGNFKRARVIAKSESRTIIPCTESSAGRTSGEAPHPLCDKLQYVASDYKKYGGNRTSYYNSYVEQLRAWSHSEFSHAKTIAVLRYVSKGRVIEDLVDYAVLIIAKSGELLEEKIKESNKETLPAIFKVISSQQDSFVRWKVEIKENPQVNVWDDTTLWESWINYYSATKQNQVLCYVTGNLSFAADQHPRNIRRDGDGAKLISSNDTSGYTFRGRFDSATQACGVGFEATQKAHSALRWLISRQGFRTGDQAIVAWATSGHEIPQLTDNALSILGLDLQSDVAIASSTAQDLGLRLRKRIAGYRTTIGKTENVVVMGIDSASPGRVAVTYYRELTGSDFLNKLEHWHSSCAWTLTYPIDFESSLAQNKGKLYLPVFAAPTPIEIAEAAYGTRLDDKLKKNIVEQLLPCIVDGRPIPRNIIESVVRRAANRIAMENWEWEKVLRIACALFRKFNEKEEYNMALDLNRTTRDYLFGRLLAIADKLEGHALNSANEKRDTNATRYMQRFAERPNKTWRQIYLSLSPYMARLGGALHYKNLIEQVTCKFESVEDFNSDKPLSGEFLLGYFCQREALWKKKDESAESRGQEIIEQTQA